MSQDRIDSLEKKVDELANIIKPMAETYAAAVRVGKWSSGILVFISIMIGIALGIKELFKWK